MLRVQSISGEEIAALPAEGFRNVLELKRHLRKLHGFAVCLQQLVCDGKCLPDEEPIVPEDLQLVVASVISQEQHDDAGMELLSATGENDLKAVRLLLQAGADESYYRNPRRMLGIDADHTTSLMMAAAEGHAEILRLLLDAGAKKDLKDFRGRTALHMAVFEGHTETVRLLVDAGADKDLRDDCGRTALILAARMARTEILSLLVNAGAEKNFRDSSGMTALMYAAAARAENDVEACHHAAPAVYFETVRLLVEAGVDDNMRDNNGMTALMHAARSGRTDIFSCLCSGSTAC
ncbi:unnamed protein product [Symbiodinium sp. CCMP2456]|nr:unnamed protein product [Symbiodinium sp. CCMP2456]